MKYPMQTQHNIEAAATVGGTMGAWALWLSSANELLITISTLLAIAVGLWTLFDKWKGRQQVDPVERKLDEIIDKVDGIEVVEPTREDSDTR